ncbi:MAG TPA: translation initiation factor IF-6 [Nitrososphaeraceae archaeon]|nr:translation initiation factor IF-6 [Nitrososphaeraceae archaeon]
MGIYKYDIYKSPNLGLFARVNNNTLVLPFGFAETKMTKLRSYLEVENVIFTSIGGTRLIGAMAVMNNKGILLSSYSSDDEVEAMRRSSGLNVERLSSRFTAVGNLVSANDKGALVSPIFEGKVDKQIQDVLGVPVICATVAGYYQIGSMIVATDTGAAVHPKASEEELQIIEETLKVETEPVTVNGGMPFLSSGLVANSKSVIVGSLTSGPELIMISRAFKV